MAKDEKPVSLDIIPRDEDISSRDEVMEVGTGELADCIRH